MTSESGSRASVESVVRYEDEDLAVVNKPAGMLVYGGRNEAEATLVETLQPVMPLAAGGGEDRAGIVHRLDRDTSGLLLIAKSDRALEALGEAMRARAISRTYLCLVAGHFNLPRGRVEAPVGRSRKDATRMAVEPGGRRAATNFKVLERFETTSYLEVSLETGRTHQIRVHLAHVKHPVIGDPVYGPATLRLASRLGLDRPFLHAFRLQLLHPFSGAEIDVTEPLPPELESSLALARRT